MGMGQVQEGRWITLGGRPICVPGDPPEGQEGCEPQGRVDAERGGVTYKTVSHTDRIPKGRWKPYGGERSADLSPEGKKMLATVNKNARKIEGVKWGYKKENRVGFMDGDGDRWMMFVREGKPKYPPDRQIKPTGKHADYLRGAAAWARKSGVDIAEAQEYGPHYVMRLKGGKFMTVTVIPIKKKREAMVEAAFDPEEDNISVEDMDRDREKAREVANAPKGASALFDKVLADAEKRKGVEKPYAVAMSVMKTRYYKGKDGKWHKRKKPLSSPGDAPTYTEAYRLSRAVRQAEMMAKEANAATMLGQLFRGKKIPPEWAIWRLLRMRRAATAAQEAACTECPDAQEGRRVFSR